MDTKQLRCCSEEDRRRRRQSLSSILAGLVAVAVLVVGLTVVDEHLRPDEMKIMVVGSKELFDQDLEIFGRMVRIELR